MAGRGGCLTGAPSGSVNRMGSRRNAGPRKSVDVEIHDLSGSGSGVGRLPDGRAVFVPRTAPGDRISVQLTRDKSRFALGDMTALHEPSDQRRMPTCRLYDRCGGCQLQHVQYRHQVDAKASRITEALRRIGGLELPADISVEAAPSEWHYRNRVRFTLRRIPGRDGGSRVIAGFHRLGQPGRILDVFDQCLLPEEAIVSAWSGVRANWGESANRLPSGSALSLTLRSAVGGVVMLIEGGDAADTDAVLGAEALVDAVPELLGVWHRALDADELALLAGAADRTDHWFGEVVPVGSKAFLQVNRELGEALHLDVLKEMGNPEGLHVIDAYCGVGAYGRRLSRHGARAEGIELDADAAEAAERDAPDGWTVHRGRVEEVLPGLGIPDRLILNPPREGLNEAVTDWLAEAEIERVVYVSCDPATLARDLKRMGPAWRVLRVKGYDLFPQTSHVETVVTLARVQSPAHSS